MRKLGLSLSVMLLAACSATPTSPPPEVKLVLPTLTKAGYFKLAPNAEYYVDTQSVWVDNEDKHLIHFDVVINSDKGLFVYKDRPELYARSVRQYKILNCDTYRLTQVRTDYYSEFWGDGIRAALRKQQRHTVKLQKNSTLYVLGQVMCANMYRKW
ncbi:hypothetical protein L5B97_07910 [Avibacterium sp. 20-15]|uniref:surface-adhesin E family protein n=1 Tax=unclassified Avibacterium TaxID=2685287 RepID=UPI00202639AA|nr:MULTISPECIES: surface-adhesin E family protein [unclassified Avibacterium]MCW9733393.1 hypothetical protein [Avibacterium sp. 20-15]URL03266.1 hypothetical protein L4F93_06600 [Avibacterium sp. 20-132]